MDILAMTSLYVLSVLLSRTPIVISPLLRTTVALLFPLWFSKYLTTVFFFSLVHFCLMMCCSLASRRAVPQPSAPGQCRKLSPSISGKDLRCTAVCLIFQKLLTKLILSSCLRSLLREQSLQLSWGWSCRFTWTSPALSGGILWKVPASEWRMVSARVQSCLLLSSVYIWTLCSPS